MILMCDLSADIWGEDFVRDVCSLMNVFAIAIPNLSLELRIVDHGMITEAPHVAELSHEAWMSTSFQLGNFQAMSFPCNTLIDRLNIL